MDLKEIGQIIRNARRAKNITQKQLAQLVNVSSVAVVAWEKGNSMPSGKALIDLSHHLNIADKLFKRHNDEDVEKNEMTKVVSEIEELKKKVQRLEASLQLKV